MTDDNSIQSPIRRVTCRACGADMDLLGGASRQESEGVWVAHYGCRQGHANIAITYDRIGLLSPGGVARSESARVEMKKPDGS